MKTITQKIHPDHPKMNHKWGVEVYERHGAPGPMWNFGGSVETKEEAKDFKERVEDNGHKARLCKYHPISNQTEVE